MEAKGTLISCEELAASGDVVVLDCRAALLDHDEGRRQFEASHIPGAQFADLESQLSGPPQAGVTGRHPLPERADFIEQVSAWGINSGQQVVAYDQNNGAFAARLWWLMRWLGHSNVAVLDGGLARWISEGRALSVSPPQTTIGNFEPGPPLTRTVSADDLQPFSGILLDARDEPRYRGEVEPIDPVKGHIPGALCRPFSANLTRDAEFKSAAEIQAEFAQEFGLTDSADVACYCGSGVTACHNILALVHAGYPEPALYPGSWSEWITQPNRPIETDA